jgi:DNA-binding transcriptional ArsR family regulator
MEKGQAIGHQIEIKQTNAKVKDMHQDDFVLEKSIFNNVFEKDIRRIFIYKKAERLAKAIHLIAPAFLGAPSLRDRIDVVAIGLVDAAILPSSAARMNLSRELLTLSSILSIARSGGLLSAMNAEIIARETHVLLQEVAEYEEPRLSLEEAPTLSEIARKSTAQSVREKSSMKEVAAQPRVARGAQESDKGQVKDTGNTIIKDRRESVMSVIRTKKVASIKDISTVIRGVSEKTIQRELLALVSEGVVIKSGERRWSTYSLA